LLAKLVALTAPLFFVPFRNGFHFIVNQHLPGHTSIANHARNFRAIAFLEIEARIHNVGYWGITIVAEITHGGAMASNGRSSNILAEDRGRLVAEIALRCERGLLLGQHTELPDLE